MRGAAGAAFLLLVSCAPAGMPAIDELPAQDDPVLDRYRCESFLDAERRDLSLEAGLRRSTAPGGGEPTVDGHLRLSAHALDLAVRRREKGEADWEAYHLSFVPLPRLRLICGDFVPDAGIGLVSSARRFSSALTPSWPLAGAGMRRWTGFYDRFIRGGGVAVCAGPASVSAFAGAAGAHPPGGTRVGGATVGGMLVAASRGPFAAGASVLAGDPSPGTVLAGLEVAASAGPATVAGELSFGGRETGAAWGSTVRLGALRAAALAYHAPFGSSGSLACIPGATQRAGASRSGAAAALRARLPSRCFLDASLERREWRDGYRSGRGTVLRARVEARRRRGSLALTVRDERGLESDCLPVPPPPAGRADRHRSAEIAGLAAAGGAASVRGALRFESYESSSGWLASAGVRLGSRGGAARIDAGGTWCRSGRGRVVFRFYEPAVPGAYQWKTVSGEYKGGYIVFLIRIRDLSVSAGGTWAQGREGRGEVSLQLKL